MFDAVINSVNYFNAIDIFFILYFSILFILWLVKVVFVSKTGVQNAKQNIYQAYWLSGNKKRFIKEVISWGINNINIQSEQKREGAVNYEVSYYRHKTIKGVFFPIQNKIRIYVNNHINIIDLIDSSLHEVVHALQYCADKKGYQKKYTKLLEEHNYASHPMEVEARLLAERNLKPCIEYLYQKGFLVKRKTEK